ncbi:hypothetical protein APED_20325 [Acanthopleuribacter pedis]
MARRLKSVVVHRCGCAYPRWGTPEQRPSMPGFVFRVHSRVPTLPNDVRPCPVLFSGFGPPFQPIRTMPVHARFCFQGSVPRSNPSEQCPSMPGFVSRVRARVPTHPNDDHPYRFSFRVRFPRSNLSEQRPSMPGVLFLGARPRCYTHERCSPMQGFMPAGFPVGVRRADSYFRPFPPFLIPNLPSLNLLKTCRLLMLHNPILCANGPIPFSTPRPNACQ